MKQIEILTITEAEALVHRVVDIQELKSLITDLNYSVCCLTHSNSNDRRVLTLRMCQVRTSRNSKAMIAKLSKSFEKSHHQKAFDFFSFFFGEATW